MLAKRSCLLLLVAVIGFYYYGLGHLPFVGPDEPRYAQVAREMFLRGDLITPTLGGQTWFEKPVLLYWALGLSFRFFGFAEWAARLGPATCGILTIFSVYFIGSEIERSSRESKMRGLGFWSALFTATMPGLIVFSRGASFDIIVTLTLTWSLGCFLLSEIEERPARSRLFLIGFYGAMGLSLLAKGLIGVVLPFGVIVVYQLLRRSFPKRFLQSLWWGIPITLLVAAIWYGPVIARHGWVFIDEFIVQHHFARYVSNKYHHPQPPYYYLLILFPLAFPWVVPAIFELGKLRPRIWRNDSPWTRSQTFALAWLLAPLIFFSFSSSKLPGYILPVLPAVSLLAGARFCGLLSAKESTRDLLAASGILLVAAIAGLIFVTTRGMLSIKCAGLILAPLILASSFAWVSKKIRLTALALSISVPLSFFLALNCEIPMLALAHSSRHLIEIANARGFGTAPIYALHEVDRGLEYYGAGRVVYGEDGQPLKFEGTAELVKIAQSRDTAILVVVPLKYAYQLLAADGVIAEVVADNGETGIVAVRRRG